MDKKSVIAWCAVGLGNKICTLIGAKFWAEKLNYNFEIVWLTDPHCLCSFERLFSNHANNCLTDTEYLNKQNILVACNRSFPCSETLIRMTRTHAASHIKSHYLKLFLYITKNKKISSTDLFLNINDIAEYNDIIYQNSVLSKEVDIEQAIRILSSFDINKTILQEVNKFIEKNNIDSNTGGIALRKTDVPIEYDHTFYVNEIESNPDKLYFLTSDDNDTKKYFKRYKNVVVFDNKSTIIWSKTSVYRDEQSVIDSFIELLILSHTTLVRDEKDIISTYFFCALLFNIIFTGITNEKVIYADIYKEKLLKNYLNERG